MMRRLAFVAGEQLSAPPRQEPERLRAAAGLVGQVVGPATVGVDRMEVRAQPGRQEDGGDGEILVVYPRDEADVLPRLRGRG